MADSLKIDVSVSRTKGKDTWSYSVPSLGLDKSDFLTVGSALDAAVRDVGSFFNGLMEHSCNGKRLGMMSFAASLKLGLNFRVINEKPLNEFAQPDLVSGSADATASSVSGKTKVKA